MFKTMGYSPGFLLKIGQFSISKESVLATVSVKNQFNRPCSKPWAIGPTVSRTCQNRPCSKPWAIAQGFCSKSANFRLLRIHLKSTQRVAKAVKNPFMRALEPFQTVWSDFQDLPKSAMFKTMGYSPGFLLKIGQFSTLANSSQIDTKSHQSS